MGFGAEWMQVLVNTGVYLTVNMQIQNLHIFSVINDGLVMSSLWVSKGKPLLRSFC